MLFALAGGAGPVTNPAPAVVPRELNDKLHAAQAAVTEAEKKLQQAIDGDPEVMAVRQRLDVARSAWQTARDGGQPGYRAAFDRYLAARAAEQEAVRRAGNDQRQELAVRQKELEDARAAVDAAAVQERKQLEQRQWEQTLPTAPQRSGDVEVSVLEVRIAPVRLAAGAGSPQSSESFLGVLIEIENLGRGNIDYAGWNSNAVANDANKKQYTPASVPGGKVQGRVVQTLIAPGTAVKDLIVLERPASVHGITILLPAFNVGGSGALEFRIPDDKVEQKNEPLIDEKGSLPAGSSGSPSAASASKGGVPGRSR